MKTHSWVMQKVSVRVQVPENVVVVRSSEATYAEVDIS